MTPDRLTHIASIFDVEIVNFGYLAHCWISREAARQWIERRNLVPPLHLFPLLPVQEESHTGLRRASTEQRGAATSAIDAGARRRGSAPAPVDYAASDSILIHEMRELIAYGKANNAWDAALQVSARAKGHGTGESKAKRLHHRFSAAFSTEHD